jgi:DNA-binding protein H-NS
LLVGHPQSAKGSGMQRATHGTSLKMTKTYAQLVKQIESLTQEAEKIRRQEVDGVIKRIKEAISVYNLSAADLGLREGGKSEAAVGAKTARRKPAAKRRAAGIVRFRDAGGNQWTGFGPKPKWLRDALASGKDISEFKV